MILRIYPLLFLVSVLISCGDSNTRHVQDKQARQENKTSSSIPQDMANIQQLSPEDKVKLAHAKGKTVAPKTIEELLEMIDSEKKELRVFSFWKLDDPLSQQQNLNLLNVQRELGEEKLKIHPICIDQLSDPMAINTYLRQYGFQDKAFYLQDSLPRRWYSQFDASWQGVLPAMLFTQKSTGTRLFYHQLLSFEELLAMMQTLTL